MKKKLINIKMKSEKGFTMQDLIVALIIIMIFTGIIGTIMVSVYKLSYKEKMTEKATIYAIQVLEDIDKIPYEEVSESLASSYIEKFSILSGYNLELEVTNYNEGTEKEDLIKKVKLTISYSMGDEPVEQIIINKLKIKELSS